MGKYLLLARNFSAVSVHKLNSQACRCWFFSITKSNIFHWIALGSARGCFWAATRASSLSRRGKKVCMASSNKKAPIWQILSTLHRHSRCWVKTLKPDLGFQKSCTFSHETPKHLKDQSFLIWQPKSESLPVPLTALKSPILNARNERGTCVLFCVIWVSAQPLLTI